MKSYVNEIRTQDVALAVEQFLIAPYGQSYTCSAAIDLESPPSGFYHLGAVVEDSPSITVSREKYTLSTGLPKSPQYETILGVSAQISFRLYTMSFYQAQFALGNSSTITTVTTIASGAVQSQYYGLDAIEEYYLLGVADFMNGIQVVHDFPKVSPADDFTDEFRTQAPEMQMTFNALSTVQTIGGCRQQVLGKRHYINSGTTC